MTPRHSPTVQSRRLGKELRRLRQRAGLTIHVAARHLGCSASKISRMETGNSGVGLADVRVLLNLYQVGDAEAEELMSLARQARQKGWWEPYGEVLSGSYVGLEAAAETIRGYEVQVVPGLLQTAAYARAMIGGARLDIDDEELDRRVNVRMARQALLTQHDPVKLSVILDEALFRRLVGGREVMREQFERLLGAVDLPNVVIQVLPFAVGAHAGMEGGFAILHYADAGDTDVVFAENAAGGLFLTKDEELRRYDVIFDHLREKALDPDESRAFIAASIREL
ncbi:MAG TPA: helix-turn-helix transcriptional regulator [Micromonosporaceae bacterium]